MTSPQMTSFCEILGFGEVIWLQSVGTIQGSHQLDHDAMPLSNVTAGSCLLHYILMIGLSYCSKTASAFDYCSRGSVCARSSRRSSLA